MPFCSVNGSGKTANVIEEALVETIGCSGMTHSAAMAAEVLPGRTVMEALNTDLVCDAINTAMRELFLQIVYGRTQSAFSTPADTVSQTGNVFDIFGFYPFCFFGDGSCAVINTLCNCTHLFYFL